MSAGRVLSVALLLAGAFIAVLPFLWMLSLSLKGPEEIFTPTVDLLPSGFRWENYAAALTRTNLPLYLLNGAIVCAGILAFQLLAPSAKVLVFWMEYLSQTAFPFNRLAFWVLMSALETTAWV